MLNNHDVALLVLRLGVSYVFLYAAWKNTENAAAWDWTRNETSLLFQQLPEPRRSTVARLAAVIGMCLMYGGGASILFGLESRLGGVAIAVFSVLGMRIHAIRRDEAKRVAEAGAPIAWSAFSAHIAAGLKNVAFVGLGVFFALVGSGAYSVSDCVGHWLAR